MSQIWVKGGSTPVGSDIQTITPDQDSGGGPGLPVGPDAAFNINLTTGDGLTTIGDVATNTIVVTFDGIQTGAGQTIGAVTADLITFPLGTTPGVYVFTVDIVGFDAATPLGVAYFLTGAARTTGAFSIEIPGQNSDDFEEGVLIGCDNDLFCDGGGNNVIVRATGVAGKTIRWQANMLYTFRS